MHHMDDIIPGFPHSIRTMTEHPKSLSPTPASITPDHVSSAPEMIQSAVALVKTKKKKSTKSKANPDCPIFLRSESGLPCSIYSSKNCPSSALSKRHDGSRLAETVRGYRQLLVLIPLFVAVVNLVLEFLCGRIGGVVALCGCLYVFC